MKVIVYKVHHEPVYPPHARLYWQHAYIEARDIFVPSTQLPDASAYDSIKPCRSELVPVCVGDNVIGHVSQCCPHGHIYCTGAVTESLALLCQEHIKESS